MSAGRSVRCSIGGLAWKSARLAQRSSRRKLREVDAWPAAYRCGKPSADSSVTSRSVPSEHARKRGTTDQNRKKAEGKSVTPEKPVSVLYLATRRRAVWCVRYASARGAGG